MNFSLDMVLPFDIPLELHKKFLVSSDFNGFVRLTKLTQKEGNDLSSPAHIPNCKSQMGNSKVHNSDLEAQPRVFSVIGEAVSTTSKHFCL